jgi:hypothetical protein
MDANEEYIRKLERQAALADQLAEALQYMWSGVPGSLREVLMSYPDRHHEYIFVMAGDLKKTKAALEAWAKGG